MMLAAQDLKTVDSVLQALQVIFMFGMITAFVFVVGWGLDKKYIRALWSVAMLLFFVILEIVTSFGYAALG